MNSDIIRLAFVKKKLFVIFLGNGVEGLKSIFIFYFFFNAGIDVEKVHG